MRCLVTMFSCDRYAHLRLCLGCYLLKADRTKCKVLVIDDGSKDERIHAYLRNLSNKGEIEVMLEPAFEGSGEARIGNSRRTAVRVALAERFDYLLMLDDDIVVGPTTIQQALANFEALKTMCNGKFRPGALSLHHPHSILTTYVLDGSTYSEAGIGGEANVLLPFDAMEKHGEQFGPQVKGFGDNYFRAIRKDGYTYLSRRNPPYEVQHIGIGVGGSVIHGKKDKMPFWVTKLYQDWNLDKPLGVGGFDARLYQEAIVAAGPMEAPAWYMKHRKRV